MIMVYGKRHELVYVFPPSFSRLGSIRNGYKGRHPLSALQATLIAHKAELTVQAVRAVASQRIVAATRQATVTAQTILLHPVAMSDALFARPIAKPKPSPFTHFAWSAHGKCLVPRPAQLWRPGIFVTSIVLAVMWRCSHSMLVSTRLTRPAPRRRTMPMAAVASACNRDRSGRP